MKPSNAGSSEWAASSKKNTLWLAYWTFGWVATHAVAAFGPKFLWDHAILPSIAAVLANLAVGFGMIIANRHYLRGMDELHQKIFLEAGALTLGVGLVCGLSYELLHDIRLVAFEAEISHLVVLMALTFLAGMIAGYRKYQ